MKRKGKKTYRVVTFIKREELDFLDDLSKDIYFTYGINIPRTKLIEEILSAFKEDQGKTRKEIEEDLINRFNKEADDNKK